MMIDELMDTITKKGDQGKIWKEIERCVIESKENERKILESIREFGTGKKPLDFLVRVRDRKGILLEYGLYSYDDGTVSAEYCSAGKQPMYMAIMFTMALIERNCSQEKVLEMARELLSISRILKDGVCIAREVLFMHG